MAKFNLGKVLESGLGILREFRNPSEPINTSPFIPDISWPPNLPGLPPVPPGPVPRQPEPVRQPRRDNSMRNILIGVGAFIGLLVVLRIFKVI